MATAGHNDRQAEGDTASRLLQSQSYQTHHFAFCFCPCEKQFVHSFRQACWMEVISNDWLQAEMSGLGLQGNRKPFRVRILIEQLSLCVMYRCWWRLCVCVCVCVALILRIIQVSANRNKSALQREMAETKTSWLADELKSFKLYSSRSPSITTKLWGP